MSILSGVEIVPTEIPIARSELARVGCGFKKQLTDALDSDSSRSDWRGHRDFDDGLVLCGGLDPSAVYVSRDLAHRIGDESHCRVECAAICNLRGVCVSGRVAARRFARGCDEAGGCSVDRRAAAANSYQCGVYQAAPDICGVVFGGLAGEAGDRGDCGVVGVAMSLIGGRA